MRGEYGNYLRVRGEYLLLINSKLAAVELPPRARRILMVVPAPPVSLGTTSACAENTSHYLHEFRRFRNYLRVRGEYADFHARNALALELPPRARRILPITLYSIQLSGTTSACAENTPARHQIPCLP